MGASRKKLVGVTPRANSIDVRFKYGKKKFTPRLRLRPTAANLHYAARIRQEIMADIAEGRFDLLKYFPDYKFASRIKPVTPAQARNFGDWVAVWEKLAAREHEHSTLSIYKRHLKRYWTSEFRDMHPREITNEVVATRIAELACEHMDPRTGKVRRGLDRKTQNNILIPLRAVFGLISRSPGCPSDPTVGINNLKLPYPIPDPFTADELERALAMVRQEEGDIVADYFEFAGFVGLRPSEQICITWDAVDFSAKTLLVNKARVMGQSKARTKTFKPRTIELNERAWAVIERQRARTGEPNAEIFINPSTGRPWADDQVQCRIWKKALALSGIRHRPPKELRDTSVTLALMAGADPYWVARQHGHSLRVMERDYARWYPGGDGNRNRNLVNRALANTGTGSGAQSAS